MRHDQEIWKEGPEIPDFGLDSGCGVRISDKELLIIGGYNTENRILRLTTDDDTWHETSIQLPHPKIYHRCIVYNNKVIIAGGFDPTNQSLPEER